MPPVESLESIQNHTKPTAGSERRRAASKPARVVTEVRPQVARFAIEIENVLRRHDPVKGGAVEWRKLTVRAAYAGLFREIQELEREVDACSNRRLKAETVDVGATATILFDVARRRVARS